MAAGVGQSNVLSSDNATIIVSRAISRMDIGFCGGFYSGSYLSSPDYKMSMSASASHKYRGRSSHGIQSPQNIQWQDWPGWNGGTPDPEPKLALTPSGYYMTCPFGPTKPRDASEGLWGHQHGPAEQALFNILCIYGAFIKCVYVCICCTYHRIR